MPIQIGKDETPRSRGGVHHSWRDLLCRRDMLKVAGAGIGASLWPDKLCSRAAAPSRPMSSSAPAHSVIVLWMAGGVTHIDSFDPKPEAPSEIRGTLTAIPTNVTGIRFCETLPALAGVANHLAVVRSFSHDSDDHLISQARALSGRMVGASQITTEPNVGALVSFLQGPRAGFPGYVAVPGTTRPGPPPVNEFTGGWLGREYGPFCTGGAPRNEDFTARVREAPEEVFLQQCLRFPIQVSTERLQGRRSLQAALEATLKTATRARDEETLARQFAGAFELLMSARVRAAFALDRESDRTRDQYGRTKIGQRCLLARRLVEAGARYVLVDYGYDPDYGNLWDNHCVPIQKQPPICKIVKKPFHLAGMDRAFAALVTDLATRGLLDRTLVVFLTEFGRTPRINSFGGRDHWGLAGSLFFAGAGVRGGQVIGGTDRTASRPTGQPYGPADVAATTYAALGIDPSTVVYDRENRPIPVLPEGRPISGILTGKAESLSEKGSDPLPSPAGGLTPFRTDSES